MSGWTRLQVRDARLFETVAPRYDMIDIYVHDDGVGEAYLYGYGREGDALDIAQVSGASDALIVAANDTSDMADANMYTLVDAGEGLRHIGGAQSLDGERFDFEIGYRGLYLTGERPTWLFSAGEHHVSR